MYFIIPYAVWNVIVFFIYGIDKYKAKARTWRIPEKTLIMCAVLLGAVGAYAGMEIFRHKTKHTMFKIVVPFLAIVNIAILIAFGIAPEKLRDILDGLTKN